MLSRPNTATDMLDAVAPYFSSVSALRRVRSPHAKKCSAGTRPHHFLPRPRPPLAAAPPLRPPREPRPPPPPFLGCAVRNKVLGFKVYVQAQTSSASINSSSMSGPPRAPMACFGGVVRDSASKPQQPL